MKDLKKLMEKKKDGKEMDPTYRDAKMSTLKALKDEMVSMMKDDLQKPGMKKVEVASDDDEGLAHGLDKAREMLSAHNSEQDDDDADAIDADQHGAYDASPEMDEPFEEEHSNLSPEEEEILASLLAKKKMM